MRSALGRYDMSVLYKALQKAEKENEQRQVESAGEGFDAERLAGAGTISAPSGRSMNWPVIGIASAVVLAVVIGTAFFLFQPASAPQVAVNTPAQPAPVLQPPAPVEPAESTVAANVPENAAAPETMPADRGGQIAQAPVEPSDVSPQVMEDAPAEPVAAETEMAAAPEPEPQTSSSAPRAPAPQPSEAEAREPMPQLAEDSPARMLSPPVTINRGDFALAGVGDAVQVRNVAQQAQDNAGAGYSALIRGEYDTALAFYDQALQQEPRSVLALLGRGAALQRLGRAQEAHGAYDAVLRLDPQNREALTNLTAIVGERAPNEALARLLELEREHPNFSPVTAQIGLTYAKMGSMAQAQTYLRRAVALTPDAVMYHYNLALVLDHMNLGDQAVRSYENVLAALAGGRTAVGLSSLDIERRVRYLRTR